MTGNEAPCCLWHDVETPGAAITVDGWHRSTTFRNYRAEVGDGAMDTYQTLMIVFTVIGLLIAAGIG